jgi:hypothetical protein
MSKRFMAVARDGYNSFPSITRSTKEDAIAAGIAQGKPFDVHDPKSGVVVWTWEQRPDEIDEWARGVSERAARERSERKASRRGRVKPGGRRDI